MQEASSHTMMQRHARGAALFPLVSPASFYNSSQVCAWTGCAVCPSRCWCVWCGWRTVSLRFFVLLPSALLYYLREHRRWAGMRARGLLELGRDTSAALVEGRTRKFVLRGVVRQGQDYSVTLAAPSEQEAARWLGKLQVSTEGGGVRRTSAEAADEGTGEAQAGQMAVVVVRYRVRVAAHGYYCCSSARRLLQ